MAERATGSWLTARRLHVSRRFLLKPVLEPFVWRGHAPAVPGLQDTASQRKVWFENDERKE